MKSNFLERDISRSFSAYPVLSNLTNFSNAENSMKFAWDYIERKVHAAKVEGIKVALDDIRRKATQQMNEYLDIITHTANFVVDISKNNLKHIKIKEIRTNFHFITREMRILFIIDTDSKEKELEFLKLLGEVERAVLKKDKYLCDLIYINLKDTKLDRISIDNDFPYERIQKK
jgi:hypothetical protein